MNLMNLIYETYESYSAHENVTGTTYPYTTVEPITTGGYILYGMTISIRLL